MNVSDTETRIIWGLDVAGRRKQLADSAVGMMKVLEMAVVLSGEESGFAS